MDGCVSLYLVEELRGAAVGTMPEPGFCIKRSSFNRPLALVVAARGAPLPPALLTVLSLVTFSFYLRVTLPVSLADWFLEFT